MNSDWRSTLSGEINGNQIYQRHMANFEANFHRHEDTDEAFIVLSGDMYIDFEDRSVHLVEGHQYVVAKGILHRARVPNYVHVIVISQGLNG